MTDRPTDTLSCGDARTHLKIKHIASDLVYKCINVTCRKSEGILAQSFDERVEIGENRINGDQKQDDGGPESRRHRTEHRTHSLNGPLEGKQKLSGLGVVYMLRDAVVCLK